MVSVLTFLFVLVCIMLLAIILLQSSKGGGMGSAISGQSMNDAFGGGGADKLLVRITATLAIIFMLLAISIQWFGKSNTQRFDEVNNQALPSVEDVQNSNNNDTSNQGIPLPNTTTE